MVIIAIIVRFVAADDVVVVVAIFLADFLQIHLQRTVRNQFANTVHVTVLIVAVVAVAAVIFIVVIVITTIVSIFSCSLAAIDVIDPGIYMTHTCPLSQRCVLYSNSCTTSSIRSWNHY